MIMAATYTAHGYQRSFHLIVFFCSLISSYDFQEYGCITNFGIYHNNPRNYFSIWLFSFGVTFKTGLQVCNF